MIVGGEPKPPLAELSHFGVKGMRWGHHSAKTASAPKPKKVKKQMTKEDWDRRQRQFAVTSILLSAGAIAVSAVIGRSGGMSYSGLVPSPGNLPPLSNSVANAKMRMP